MRTWHYEVMVISVALCATTLFFQNNTINWLTTLAVIITFNHAQIADRLQEGQKRLLNPDVKCYWKLNWLFASKEVLWILVFVLMGNYAAIVGSVLFALYPVWRKGYRRVRPVGQKKRIKHAMLLDPANNVERLN